MIRFFRIAAFSIIFFLMVTNKVHAESNYVLPYPSTMPGGLSYKIHLIYEKISKYWYFGDLGQFHYSLKMTDKYLIEAKILFEYKQYLLGYKALQKSDSYFLETLPSLMKAKKNNKDIVQKKSILSQVALKHIEILEEMRVSSPDAFNWQPEKALPTMLRIEDAMENAIAIRRNAL